MDAKQITFQQLAIIFSCILFLEWVLVFIPFGAWYPQLLQTALTRLLDIAIIICFVKTIGDGYDSLGLARASYRNGLRTGIIWSACFGAFAFLGIAFIYLLGPDPAVFFKMRLPGTTGGVICFFITGGIVAPIAEELFFRGLLFGFLRRWGLMTALLISTAVFAVMHGLQSIPVTQIIGGIVFALAYEKSGSLIAPIIIHILANTALFSLGALLT